MEFSKKQIAEIKKEYTYVTCFQNKNLTIEQATSILQVLTVDVLRKMYKDCRPHDPKRRSPYFELDAGCHNKQSLIEALIWRMTRDKIIIDNHPQPAQVEPEILPPDMKDAAWEQVKNSETYEQFKQALIHFDLSELKNMAANEGIRINNRLGKTRFIEELAKRLEVRYNEVKERGFVIVSLAGLPSVLDSNLTAAFKKHIEEKEAAQQPQEPVTIEAEYTEKTEPEAPASAPTLPAPKPQIATTVPQVVKAFIQYKQALLRLISNQQAPASAPALPAPKPQPQPKAPKPAKPKAVKDRSTVTVKQLRERAKHLGIPKYYRMRKAELIEAIDSFKLEQTISREELDCTLNVLLKDIPTEEEAIKLLVKAFTKKKLLELCRTIDINVWASHLKEEFAAIIVSDYHNRLIRERL